jgi:hypothetical protein
LSNSNVTSITSEVENRLDHLFSDEGKSPEFIEARDGVEESPLKELKANLLSMDWEISDQIMEDCIAQITELKQIFKEDGVLLYLFKILGSLCKYIRNHGADSLPEAMKLVKSVYNAIESIIVLGNVTALEKKKVLLSEVRKFKGLKRKIAQAKAKPVQTDVEDTPVESEPVLQTVKEQRFEIYDTGAGPEAETLEPPPLEELSPQEVMANAMAEIKKMIHEEFDALRSDLRSWMDGHANNHQQP